MSNTDQIWDDMHDLHKIIKCAAEYEIDTKYLGELKQEYRKLQEEW